MTTRRGPLVLFAVAAGPELGFGHLVRAGVLASTLGAPRELVLRGTESARMAALRFGWSVHQGPDLIAALLPDLIVVDDPSPEHRARWIRLGRQAHIPVAAIFDGGSEKASADLIVDGSFTARPDHRPHRCAGPAWAVLPTAIASRRLRPLVRDRHRVLVALGGGAHVRRLGVSIARAIVAAMPDLRVDVAAGFTGRGVPLPPGCRWIEAPSGLTDHLASAGIAVVAGGVTMYEACALGTPCVAIPVVDAQRPAITAAVSAGAATTVAPTMAMSPAVAVAEAVQRLRETPGRAVAQAAVASRVVDGGGAGRVASRLRELVRSYPRGGRRHAA